jgi:hypothetical protein
MKIAETGEEFPPDPEECMCRVLTGPIDAEIADVIWRTHPDLAYCAALLNPGEDHDVPRPDELSPTLQFWSIVMGHQHFDPDDMVHDVVHEVVAGWIAKGELVP